MLNNKGSEEGHPICSPEQRLSGVQHWPEENAAPNCILEHRTELPGRTKKRGRVIHVKLRSPDFILITLGAPKSLHTGVTLSDVFHKGHSGIHMEHTSGEGSEGKTRKMLPCQSIPREEMGLAQTYPPHQHLGSPDLPLLSLPTASGIHAAP